MKKIEIKGYQRSIDSITGLYETSQLEIGSTLYLTPEQVEDLKKQLQEPEELEGWFIYENEVGPHQIEEEFQKETHWPTKEMALAARKLCKMMWDENHKFPPNELNDYVCHWFKKLAKECK